MRNKTKRQWFLMTIGLAVLAVISRIATGTVIATTQHSLPQIIDH